MIDEARAERAVRFVRALKHTKGRDFAGRRFALQPWQEDPLRHAFGALTPEGRRQVRTWYLEVPRKNGKTELAAAIALYLLFADGEPGAEVYSAAADKDQAGLVFSAAAQMVRQSPELSRRCAIIDSQKRIVVSSTASFYRALSSEAYTKHGLNAHGIIFDELHAQPNRELWDVLTTSQGSRTQPLTLAITTAGWFDPNAICWELHTYAEKVAAGVLDDPSFLATLYGAAEADDWTSPEVWGRANPNFGVSVQPDFLKSECQRAKENPAQENTFRRLYLNQWTRQESRWLSIDTWDACGRPIDWADYEGRDCYAGLDLASTTDLTALLLVFPPEGEAETCEACSGGGVVEEAPCPTCGGTGVGEVAGEYAVQPHFFVPGDNVQARVRRDKVPYDLWLRQGHINETPGNTADYGFVLHRLGELMQRFRLRELAFDRWGSQKLVADLQSQLGFSVDPEAALHNGAPVLVQFGQGFKDMSPPTKWLEKLLLGRKLAHEGNPVLRWNFDNVVVVKDAAENLKVDKGKSTERVDGVVALVMALGRAAHHQAGGGDPYERRLAAGESLLVST